MSGHYARGQVKVRVWVYDGNYILILPARGRDEVRLKFHRTLLGDGRAAAPETSRADLVIDVAQAIFETSGLHDGLGRITGRLIAGGPRWEVPADRDHAAKASRCTRIDDRNAGVTTAAVRQEEGQVLDSGDPSAPG